MRVALMTLLVASQAVTGATPAGVDRVAWLQGCWILTAGGRTVEEQWTSPRGGVMLGTGRTVKDGALLDYEFVVIRERGAALVYEAHPSGQPAAEFVSQQIESGSVVFENAQHDFPQQVGYRLREAGLDAWIAGTVDGKPRKVDFRYERAACPGR